jgi:O-antigen/teichoic acid export membrane protein
VRMDLSSKKPWKLMLRASVLMAGVALLAIIVLLLGGKPLIDLLFGKPFLGAYRPLVILMAIPFTGILSFSLLPMLYALGRTDGPLKAKLLGSAIFFLTIAPLSRAIGVAGAAVALVLGHIANITAMTIQLKREHRRVRRPVEQASTPDNARST